MLYQIKQIHLSIEKEGIQKIDRSNAHTDVIIEMQNEEIYVATFYTFTNLEYLHKLHKNTGEFLGGKFFWAKNMIFVEELTKEIIVEVVHKLIEESDFHLAFKRV